MRKAIERGAMTTEEGTGVRKLADWCKAPDSLAIEREKHPR